MDQSDTKKRMSDRIKLNSKIYKEFESDDEEAKLAIFNDSGSDFEVELRELKKKRSVSSESSDEEEISDTKRKPKMGRNGQ